MIADTNFSPQKQATLTVSPQAPTSIFSPDGTWLYAGGFDGSLRRWSLTPLLESLSADVEADVEANASKAALTAAQLKKRQADLTQLASTLEPQTYTEHHGWVESLAAREARLVSSDSWGAICCWDTSGETLKRIWKHESGHDGWIRSVAFSQDGARIATCGRDQTVRIWAAADGKLLGLRRHTNDLTALTFHADGRLFVGDSRGMVFQCDADAWPSPAHSDGEPDIAAAPALPAAKFDGSSLYKYDRIQDVGGVKVIAIDAESGQLAVAGTAPSRGATVQGVPTMLLFDIETGELSHTLSLGAAKDCYVHAIQKHAAGFWMVVTCGTPGTGQLLLVRPQESKPFYVDSRVANPHSLCFNEQTQLLCVNTTNKGSNGNGRRLNADGEYAGNSTPIEILTLAKS